MTDTSNVDFSPDAGHFEELSDEVHSPHWVPNRPPIPSSPQNFRPAFQPADQPQFQIPGQSSNVWNRGRDQPTTVAGRAPQPQHPPNMGPGGDPRYNKFPPGFPLPPVPSFQPYARPLPNREVSDWGTPPPYPNLPQQFELPGLFQGLGQYFQNNGMGQSGEFGLLLQIYNNAHQKAAMKGQLEQMKLAEEQMNLQSAMLEENEQRGITAYADIIGEYEAAAGQTDPDKVGNYAINGMDVRQALELKAGELQDRNLQGLLASGAPMSRVIQYMKQHEANWRALHAANKAASKDAENAKDLTDWGVPGASAGDIQGATPSPMPGSSGGVQYGLPSSAPDPNAPSPQAQPVNAGSQPETQGDRVSAMPDYQRQGIELLRGGNMQGVPKAVQPYVKKFADQTLGQMDDLVAKARDGKMSKDQIEQELRKINPAIAGEFAGIRDLNNPLPGGMGALNANPFWRDISALAESSVPGWRVSDYAQRSEMQKDYTTGPRSKRMQAANNMANAAYSVLHALKDIPEGASPPENWISKAMSRTLTGAPEWVRLFTAIQTYVQESQSLANASGRFFEGDVNRLMHEFDIAQGTDTIRGVLGVDAENAVRNLQDLNDTYQNTVRGQTPPYYNPKSMAVLGALAQMDPKRGFADVPNLPPDLQGLGMGRIDAPPSAGPAPSASPSPGWGTLQ